MKINSKIQNTFAIIASLLTIVTITLVIEDRYALREELSGVQNQIVIMRIETDIHKRQQTLDKLRIIPESERSTWQRTVVLELSNEISKLERQIHGLEND